MFDHDVSGEFVDTIPAACVADSGSAALSQVKWLQPHVVLVDLSDAGPRRRRYRGPIKQTNPATKVVRPARVSCSKSSIGANSEHATIAIFDNRAIELRSPRARCDILDIIDSDLPGGQMSRRD